MKIIFLDNFDSFTYNLVAQFKLIGHEVTVFRNNISADVVASKLLDDPSHRLLVLSPGPSAPESAGCMMDLIEKVAGKVPILGICLGHQALVKHYGGLVERAPVVVHGKACAIKHGRHPVFSGLGTSITVGRYHSLVATVIPPSLDIIAVSDDSLVMAIAHKHDRVLGFQFHPESILTINGQALLENSIPYLTDRVNEPELDKIAV